MKKNRLGAVILLVVGISLLTGCWNSRELRDLAIVVGMGIDKVQDTGQYRVSFQIVNPGAIAMGARGGGGGPSMPVTVYTGVDHTLFGALRKTSKKVPRQLFFAHIQLLIIGEELAKEGIKDLFDFYERSHELRMNSPVLVARGTDAESILKVVTPLENTPATGIAKRLEVTSRIFAQNVDVNVTDVVKGLAGPSGLAISGVHIAGDASAGESKRNLEETDLPASVEMKGIALFQDGKLKTWADGKEARGVLWLQDKMKGTIMNMGCKENRESISIELLRSKTDVKVNLQHGLPVFHVHVSEEGNVNEVHCPIDLSKRETIVKLQDEWADETKQEIIQALELAQREKIDIFNFGRVVNRTYPNLWKKMEKKWPETFAESKVLVSVDAYLRRTGMRIKPYLKEE
jgi:spore germination protein KC